MALLDIFIGVPASKYAGLAILVALLVVAVVILASKDAVPLSQKFSVVLLLFLLSLPGILMTLFQLTCLVTGAGFKRESRWWCNWYAWILSALIILYSIMIITVAVFSMSSDKSINTIMTAMEGFEEEKKAEEKKAAADAAAKEMFQAAEEAAAQKAAEGFYQADADPAVKADVPTKPATAAPAAPAAPAAKKVTEGFYQALREEETLPEPSEPETFMQAGAPY